MLPLLTTVLTLTLTTVLTLTLNTVLTSTLTTVLTLTLTWGRCWFLKVLLCQSRSPSITEICTGSLISSKLLRVLHFSHEIHIDWMTLQRSTTEVATK